MSEAHEICPFCKFDWDGSTGQLQVSLRSASERFAGHIAGMSDDVLRTRPAQDVWSALEYVAHTRDGVDWYAGRIRQMLAEDRPQLSGFDWERETDLRRYHEESTDDVLSGLARASEALADLLSSLSEDDWRREAVGSGGDPRDILLHARRAAHETEHHCVDCGRSLDDVTR